MTSSLQYSLYERLSQIVLIDPHTHINPHSPASRTLADILGYHYYTELAHSSGMPRERIEEPGISPKEKVGRLVEGLGPISNTVQFSWFIELAQQFFGLQADYFNASNWESVYDAAAKKMQEPGWEEEVLRLSKIEAIFLTNDFDDPLVGFDTSRYIPCLRTDDLVFHLAQSSVQQRLMKATGQEFATLAQLRRALGDLFTHFVKHQARACAISLPPDFSPVPISAAAAEEALTKIGMQGESATFEIRRILGYWVFWTLAELCSDHGLPFDLMIGVNRRVYPGGVFQGQDLYDSRVSMIQYAPLFNAFSKVVFPISVLASVTNQELVDYAWIFPNVVTHGHWWYSNTPSFIRRDLTARLEAIPRTKQIGYYSDMYKLEFALPKFNMFKRILARVLADDFVIAQRWTEEQAYQLGHDILRGNVERIFYPAAT